MQWANEHNVIPWIRYILEEWIEWHWRSKSITFQKVFLVSSNCKMTGGSRHRTSSRLHENTNLLQVSQLFYVHWITRSGNLRTSGSKTIPDLSLSGSQLKSTEYENVWLVFLNHFHLLVRRFVSRFLFILAHQSAQRSTSPRHLGNQNTVDLHN